MIKKIKIHDLNFIFNKLKNQQNNNNISKVQLA